MAALFVDRKDRVWRLDLDWFLVEELDTRLGFKVDDLIGENFAALGGVFSSVKRFGQVLWLLLEEQAQAAAIDEKEFARGFDGATFQRAAKAFVEALADFIPPHQGEVLRALVERGEELTGDVIARAVDQIRQFSLPPWKPATPTPASSASNPEPEGSHSASSG